MDAQSTDKYGLIGDHMHALMAIRSHLYVMEKRPKIVGGIAACSMPASQRGSLEPYSESKVHPAGVEPVSCRSILSF